MYVMHNFCKTSENSFTDTAMHSELQLVIHTFHPGWGWGGGGGGGGGTHYVWGKG